MTQKAVTTKVYYANYRSSAGYGDNVLGQLLEAHPVEVLGPAISNRWLPCAVEGVGGTVFLSNRVLRNRCSAVRENLVHQCVKEWDRFGRGTGKEYRTPYSGYVGEYWRSIGLNYSGTDTQVPWSAAFISFCVLTAGGYSGFNHNSAHSQFVHTAINDRLNDSPAGFWGFRPTEHKPQIGDLVCRRRTSANITFDYAAGHARYKSHCDFVISVRDNHVSTLGGNLSNSVKRRTYPLTHDGYLKDAKGVYAILRNNM